MICTRSGQGAFFPARASVPVAATALVPADVTMALDRFLEILYP
ncbi:hypothetical protein [Streptomyces sp. NPDC056660]